MGTSRECPEKNGYNDSREEDMKLCSYNHEEICFEGRRCPVCELKEEITAWEKEGEELKARIECLKDEIIDKEQV